MFAGEPEAVFYAVSSVSWTGKTKINIHPEIIFIRSVFFS